MKLFVGNGKTLEVYDLGPMLGRLSTRGGVPIKMHGHEILDERAARERLKELIGADVYDWEKLA